MCSRLPRSSVFSFFFFFNDTATTEIYTLSLHDALPISQLLVPRKRLLNFAKNIRLLRLQMLVQLRPQDFEDRKSTRLNSSHQIISYAVFCLKKKKVQAGWHRSALAKAIILISIVELYVL